MEKFLWTDKREAARFLVELFKAKGRKRGKEQIIKRFNDLEKDARGEGKFPKQKNQVQGICSGGLCVLYIKTYDFCVYGTGLTFAGIAPGGMLPNFEE